MEKGAVLVNSHIIFGVSSLKTLKEILIKNVYKIKITSDSHLYICKSTRCVSLTFNIIKMTIYILTILRISYNLIINYNA